MHSRRRASISRRRATLSRSGETPSRRRATLSRSRETPSRQPASISHRGAARSRRKKTPALATGKPLASTLSSSSMAPRSPSLQPPPNRAHRVALNLPRL
jgi:hypothetical protein